MLARCCVCLARRWVGGGSLLALWLSGWFIKPADCSTYLAAVVYRPLGPPSP